MKKNEKIAKHMLERDLPFLVLNDISYYLSIQSSGIELTINRWDRKGKRISRRIMKFKTLDK